MNRSSINRRCELRKRIGAKKYGPQAFRKKNMWKEAVDELYDFMNYIDFQVLKEKKNSYKSFRLKDLKESACHLIYQLDEIKNEKLPQWDN